MLMYFSLFAWVSASLKIVSLHYVNGWVGHPWCNIIGAMSTRRASTECFMRSVSQIRMGRSTFLSGRLTSRQIPSSQLTVAQLLHWQRRVLFLRASFPSPTPPEPHPRAKASYAPLGFLPPAFCRELSARELRLPIIEGDVAASQPAARRGVDRSQHATPRRPRIV